METKISHVTNVERREVPSSKKNYMPEKLVRGIIFSHVMAYMTRICFFPESISHVMGINPLTPFRVGIGHVILGCLVSEPYPSSRN